MKKLQYTTNDPASSTDYLAGDNTWKPMSGGGGGVPYTGATADVDLGTYKLFAGGVGIGTNTPAHELEVQSNDQCIILAQTSNTTGGGMAMMDANTTDEFQVGVGAFADRLCLRSNSELFKFPTAQGTSGQAIVTDGSGNLSFATPTSKSFMGTLIGFTMTAGQTVYGNFNYTTINTNELARIFVLPYACTVSNFYVRIFTAQPASGSIVYTVRKNQVDTAVVVTIAAGSAAATEANSGATSATYSAGDDMTFKAVNNAATTSANTHNFSILVEI